MKTLLRISKMKILKYVGIGLLVLIAGLFGLIILGMIIFAPNEKKVDSKELLRNTEFKNLHKSVALLDSVTNIAVLPDETYIVIDGVVINLKKRTFGYEPDFGFYASYYAEGDKEPFQSLDSLLSSKNIKMDSSQTMMIIEKMNRTDISDIFIANDEISYRWKVSAMHGEEGILYSKNSVAKDSLKYDLLEAIDEDFYHFAVYQ